MLKKEPQLQIIDFDKDKIKIEIVAWVSDPKLAWDFSCEIRERLFNLFKKEKLF